MPATQPRPLALPLPRCSTLSAYMSCIRYLEVLVLQGSPLLGTAFAVRETSVAKVAIGALFAAASFMLVAHIWSFNDWADSDADLNDPNKSHGVASTNGISRRGLLGFSLILLALSL